MWDYVPIDGFVRCHLMNQTEIGISKFTLSSAQLQMRMNSYLEFKQNLVEIAANICDQYLSVTRTDVY